MLTKVVLIIDKRREQSVKYKKILDNIGISTFVAKDFPQALRMLNDFEPDLILISDSLNLDICKAIEQIRVLSYNARPVIVALSKSNHIQDKINVLDSGADDFLSEPIVHEEFSARVNAHLRRNFENSLTDMTMLFDSKISNKMLKRTLHQEKPWAAMLVGVDNINSYREIYGELATSKIFQTYAAIIKMSVDADDYVGHLSNDDFFIITNPLKAEKIASYFVYAFDTVVNKFYTESDIKRGYMLMNGDDEVGNKMPLVTTSIGIISGECKKYNDVKQAINSLIYVHKLAKHKNGSAYIMERHKISADNAVSTKKINNNLYIIEPDIALSMLLYTAGELQGYCVKVSNDYSEAYDKLNDFNPAVIILDAGTLPDMKGIEFCKQLKSDDKFKNTNIIFTSTLHEKERILNAGADLYLPKPYEISTIFEWVVKLMDTYNL